MARKKQLTDLTLQRYKPKGGREILWDRDGLGILIGKRKKTWIFQYSFDGRRPMITLGTYPTMSLVEAQKEAGEARLKVSAGIDPGAVRKSKRAARKAAPTVAEAIDELYDIELKEKKSGLEVKRLLLHDAVPEWGGRKVEDITRRDINLLLDTVKERAPITANRLHSALSRLFGFCVERGIMENSPFAFVKKRVKETPKVRVLNDDELKKLWAGLDLDNKVVDIYRAVKLAIKMLLLTGCRPVEITGMRWTEIKDGILTIPKERMKGKEAHEVPLTLTALELLEQARSLSGDSLYVFRSTHKDGSPITPGSLSRALLRHRDMMEIEIPFTPHDARRTLRTRLAELKVDDVVAERVLGHKLQGVLKVYNRHSYIKEKRHALEKWEGKLRQIVGLDVQIGKVIQMER